MSNRISGNISNRLTVQQISDMAKKSNADVTALTTSQKLLYLQLVNLYTAYRNHTYTLEQAKNIKKEFISDFNVNDVLEAVFEQHVKINNKFSSVFTEVEKSGCPLCQKLVKIFDGREKE